MKFDFVPMVKFSKVMRDVTREKKHPPPSSPTEGAAAKTCRYTNKERGRWEEEEGRGYTAPPPPHQTAGPSASSGADGEAATINNAAPAGATGRWRMWASRATLGGTAAFPTQEQLTTVARSLPGRRRRAREGR